MATGTRKTAASAKTTVIPTAPPRSAARCWSSVTRRSAPVSRSRWARGLESTLQARQRSSLHRQLRSPIAPRRLPASRRSGSPGGSFTAERMVKALQDPDDCNDGFLRDDALLVVTLIQDTYDVDSLGTPRIVEEGPAGCKGWRRQRVRLARADDRCRRRLSAQLCHPNDYDPVKNPLRLLVESVEHGFIGSICAPSYEPFFAETIESIVEFCEGFTPPPG
jgi:hypothetical protein